MCEGSGLIIGERVLITSINGTCAKCGFVFDISKVPATYEGHSTINGTGWYDVFSDLPINGEARCPHCGMDAENLSVPCNDSGYVDLTEHYTLDLPTQDMEIINDDKNNKVS